MKRDCDSACLVEDIDDFVQPLLRLKGVMDDYLSEQEDEELPVKDLFLDFYFLGHFLG